MSHATTASRLSERPPGRPRGVVVVPPPLWCDKGRTTQIRRDVHFGTERTKCLCANALCPITAPTDRSSRANGQALNVERRSPIPGGKRGRDRMRRCGPPWAGALSSRVPSEEEDGHRVAGFDTRAVVEDRQARRGGQ